MPTLPQKASTSRRVEEFVEDKDYLFFASVSKSWRLAWTGSQRPKLTAAISEDRSVRQLSHCFRYGGLRRSALVCDAAAMLGRIDLFKHALFVGCPWHTETCFSAAGGTPQNPPLGASQRLPVELPNLFRRHIGRAPACAAVASSERLSLDGDHVRKRGPPGTLRPPQMGAKQRLLLESSHLPWGRYWETFGRAAVGAGERLPLGQDLLRSCEGGALGAFPVG